MANSSISGPSSARLSTSHGTATRQTTTTSRSQTGRSRPRTAATSSGYPENQIVCAVTESHGLSPTIGISFVNLSTSEAVLCQFADTQTYARTCHKISVFSPCEILYLPRAADSSLVSVVAENLKVEESGIQMTGIDRKYWAEDSGHEFLRRLAFPDDLESLKVSAGGNYFAMCCFAAVCGLPFRVQADLFSGHEFHRARLEYYLCTSDAPDSIRVFGGFYDD